jgi:cell division protein FtsN
MKAILFVSLALLVASVRIGADPVLDRAHEREKAGDLEGSASLLASWLTANPGSTASAGAFADYLRVEQDFPVLLDRAAAFLKAGRGVPGAAAQFEGIARLFDLAGRVEQARDAYLAAHAEGAPDAALVSAFLLSLRMNDADSMSATLRQLAPGSASAQILLQSLSDLKAGHRAAARTALIGLSEQTGNPDLALKALWVLYQTSTENGDTAGQAAARSKLGTRFSASPESAIAAGPSPTASPAARTIVVAVPAPGLFAGPAAPPTPQAAQGTPAAAQSAPAAPESPAVPADTPAVPPVTPTLPTDAVPQAPPAAAPADPSSAPALSTSPAPSSSPAPSATYSVQAGSFGMKENADDLVLELSKRGFAPTVVHDGTQGKDRYRVLAGAGLPVDGAKDVLARLSAAGFSGFLVRDK